MSLWLEILSKDAIGDHEAVREFRFTLLQEVRYASIPSSSQPYNSPIEKMIFIFAAGMSESDRGMIMSRLDDFADYVADLILSQIDRSVLLVNHVIANQGISVEDLCKTFNGWLGLKRNPEKKMKWIVNHLSSMCFLGVPFPAGTHAVEEATRIQVNPVFGYEEKALVRRWDALFSWNSFKDQQELDCHFQSLSMDDSESVAEEAYDYGGLTSAKVALQLADAGFGKSLLETQIDINNLADRLNLDLANVLESLHFSKPTDGYRPIAWHNVWWDITEKYDGLPLCLELKDPACQTDQKLADCLTGSYPDVKNVNRLNVQRRRTRLNQTCDELILGELVVRDGTSRITTF